MSVRVLALAAAALLAACQTLPQAIATGPNTYEVRYDPQATTVAQADALARQRCGAAATFVSGETRFDGFAYRSYRCARSS